MHRTGPRVLSGFGILADSSDHMLLHSLNSWSLEACQGLLSILWCQAGIFTASGSILNHLAPCEVTALLCPTQCFQLPSVFKGQFVHKISEARVSRLPIFHPEILHPKQKLGFGFFRVLAHSIEGVQNLFFTKTISSLNSLLKLPPISKTCAGKLSIHVVA